MSAPARRRRFSHHLGAAGVCLVLVLFWGLTLETPSTWGWDESMHAELPAVRMLLGAREQGFGAFATALHDCQRYPFGWPLVLAALQGIVGISELCCRWAGIAAWGLTLFGLFLLGEELARAQRGGAGAPARRGDRLLPWVALGLGALSPLALHFAGTLFLEVPFTLCAVFALRAWLRRGEGGAARELAAGLWLTAALFTKFNYGLLLGFGCGLDWLCQAIVEARAGRGRAFLARGLWLAAPPLLVAGWWFLWPLPLGAEMAESHRESFAGFLGGNREIPWYPWQVRVLYATVYFSITARLFGLQLLCLLLGAREIGRPGARLLWLVFLGGTIPIWWHNFHLERFLIPGGPAIWALGALGLVRHLPRGRRAREVILGALAVAVLLYPAADAPWVADRVGLLRKNKPRQLQSQLEAFSAWSRLGAGRPTPTVGLEREAAEAIWALVTAEAGAEERVGWLGVSTELPPAAIHLALLEAGGSPGRFLRDAHRPMDVTFEGVDPKLSDEAFASYAARFEVIFTTEPPDLKGRPSRLFIREYTRRLIENLGWRPRDLGRVEVHAPDGSPLEVILFALRPPGDSPR